MATIDDLREMVKAGAMVRVKFDDGLLLGPTPVEADGSTLAYLGGRSRDEGYGIAVDESGNAYVTGFTESTDFPTRSLYQASGGGGSDVFVTKLNADGSALAYSTYLGPGVGWGIAVDGSGNAYVTGETGSTDLPTQATFQPS